ncbi:cobalt transporter subunit CbtA (proposed) [compost metagenome]
MIVRFLLAAVIAGVIAGGLQTLVQQARVTPLILEAEKYEGGAPRVHEHSNNLELDIASLGNAHESVLPKQDGEVGHESEGAMLFGLDRLSGTLLANVVIGAAYALLLMAFSLISDRALTLKNALAWGALGWAVFHLLPSMGLAPELPGVPAADLHDRQIWWAATVLASAVSLYLLAIRSEPIAKVAGLTLMFAPHIFGAPQTADMVSNTPPALAAEFAVASLSANLAFWIVVAFILAVLLERRWPTRHVA